MNEVSTTAKVKMEAWLIVADRPWWKFWIKKQPMESVIAELKDLGNEIIEVRGRSILVASYSD